MASHPKLLSAGLLTAVLAVGAPAAAGDLDDFFKDLVPPILEDVAILGTLEGVELDLDEVELAVELLVESGSLAFDPVNGLGQLGNAVFNQFQQFPVGSTVAGFTYEFDPNLAIFVRSSQGLGPVLAERAQTNGKGKLNLSLAYSRIDFDEFEGEELGELPVSFEGDTPITLPEGGRILIDQGGPSETLLEVNPGAQILLGPDVTIPFAFLSGGEVFVTEFPLFDEVVGLADGVYQVTPFIPDIEIDTDIDVDLFALFANYGVTDWLDVGVVLPLLHIHVEGKATTRGIFDPDSVSAPGVPTETVLRHEDDEDKYGIGDMILRGKARLFETDYGDLAGRIDLSLPTGDEDNLMGRGNGAFFGQMIVSEQFGRFSPHLNLGLFFDFEHSELSQLRYAAGMDVRVHERVTLAADFIGSRDLDSDGIGDDQTSVSGGLKVNVWRRLILSGNALVRLNDEGLRADVIPSAAVEYTFF